MLARCKASFVEHQKALGTIGIILLGTSLVVGLSRLSWLYSKREPIRIEVVASLAEALPAPDSENSKTGSYVASKAGKRYYLLSCSGAQTIKESNKIFFKTKAEAEARGYTPAATCKEI